MAHLPTGTVTFLLTDIEGSTALWERHAEAMRPALARHDELIAAGVRERGGVVVKSRGEGDSVFAVFGRASDAVAAACALQRALGAEAWPTDAPLRVRMALHTGEAELRQGDYYGAAVNRCARLRGIGHGGQVLLSEATAALVRDALPPGAALLDRGEHRLRDLTTPERVSQLAAPDLRADFPPLASLNVHRHNLPIQPTMLLGREREVAEVHSLFRIGARLVTLTGPGGTGKTRLSLQVAAELVDHFEDGVFLVELAPLTDPSLVAATIARVLGVRDVGGRPVLDGLKEYLRGKSVLLVLDNFEQIVVAAPVVGDLLAASPGLRVLVTSREPLRVRGEREYAVPPLALPEAGDLPAPEALSRYGAVALFLERAVAVRADFAVTTENAPAITEICARLDGLPLAIELAAARVRLLTPQAMAGRLERRLPLLMGGARDLPTRQQTLRGAIGWSHDLLDEGERRLFRRLAVFAGGWTLDAAEAVCNVDGDLDVLGGLESLVSKSLVRQDEDARGEPRFGMLETIREYARERLDDSGETATLRRLHFEQCLALALQAEPQLVRSNAAGWLERLESDHDNLRAALAWSSEEGGRGDLMGRLAGPLWSFWWMRSHFSEGRRWLDRALERELDVATRIKVLEGAGILAFFLDDLGRADALLSEMTSLARARQDDAATVSALAWHAYTARHRGDIAGAEARCAEAVALGRRMRDDGLVALSLLVLGQVANGQADFGRGAEVLEEGLTVARREDAAAIWVPHILQNLSRAVGGLGDLDGALAHAAEARELFRQRADTWGLETCDRLLMRLARLRGDAEQGAILARDNLILNRDLGVPGSIALDLDALGWIARVHGDHARAARLFAAASALRDSIGRSPLAEIRRERDEDLAIAQEALGPEAFEAAWAEGRAMSLEQAVAYALDAPVPA